MQESIQALSVHALAAIPMPLLLVTSSGGITTRNKAAEAEFPDGKTLGEALPCLLEGHPLDWATELASLHQRKRSESIHLRNLRQPLPGGASRLLDVTMAPLDGNGQTALVMVQDVTVRASMERRLALSERLAAVGKLAAQVAHELNNPLDGILRYLGLAERVCESGRPQKAGEYLSQARLGLTRMAQIIAELLDYSRSAGRTAERSAVNSLINQAVEAMSPSLQAAGVSVVCDLPDEDGCAVPGNIFQVLCNLMKNAADAMPGGGLLVITVRRDGVNVVIRVADTGPGVPAEIIDRIFEPFFSTKGGGRGAGLGLSISRDIIERAGGKIAVSNKPEGGAVFTITVPYLAASSHFGF